MSSGKEGTTTQDRDIRTAAERAAKYRKVNLALRGTIDELEDEVAYLREQLDAAVKALGSPSKLTSNTGAASATAFPLPSPNAGPSQPIPSPIFPPAVLEYIERTSTWAQAAEKRAARWEMYYHQLRALASAAHPAVAALDTEVAAWEAEGQAEGEAGIVSVSKSGKVVTLPTLVGGKVDFDGLLEDTALDGQGKAGGKKRRVSFAESDSGAMAAERSRTRKAEMGMEVGRQKKASRPPPALSANTAASYANAASGSASVIKYTVKESPAKERKPKQSSRSPSRPGRGGAATMLSESTRVSKSTPKSSPRKSPTKTAAKPPTGTTASPASRMKPLKHPRIAQVKTMIITPKRTPSTTHPADEAYASDDFDSLLDRSP